MIASLRGVLLEKELDSVVVEAGGVGYRVFVPCPALADLPQVGKDVRVHCYTHVREDALQIFGFLTREDRETFELLIKVNGVGPKLALTMLSGLPGGDLLDAIAAADHKRLQRVPGVGKKTAERVVLELKDKCAQLPRGATSVPAAQLRDGATEVVDALVNLGYKRARADKAVQRAVEASAQEPASPETLLRDALALIAEI